METLLVTVDSARAAYVAGEYLVAATEASEAIQLDSGNSDAWAIHAAASAALGDAKTASRSMRRSLRIGPTTRDRRSLYLDYWLAAHQRLVLATISGCGLAGIALSASGLLILAALPTVVAVSAASLLAVRLWRRGVKFVALCFALIVFVSAISFVEGVWRLLFGGGGPLLPPG